jgi:hypothetical protein
MQTPRFEPPIIPPERRSCSFGNMRARAMSALPTRTAGSCEHRLHPIVGSRHALTLEVGGQRKRPYRPTRAGTDWSGPSPFPATLSDCPAGQPFQRIGRRDLHNTTVAPLRPSGALGPWCRR